MIKLVRHSAWARTQLGRLEQRAKYLGDQNHPNHLNKIVLPPRNVHCVGDSALAIRVAAAVKFDSYLCHRGGKRGKRTRRKWEEIVYSTPPSTQEDEKGKMLPCLTQDERDRIESVFLKGPIQGCPARLAWHIDQESGRCDLHVLVSAINDRAVVWLNDGFGKGQQNLKLELERLVELALELINLRRRGQHPILTARQAHDRNRRKAGKLTLAEKLAGQQWDGRIASLPRVLIELGYELIKLTEKQIVIQAQNSAKILRYGLKTLIENWKRAKSGPQRWPEMEENGPPR